MDVQCFKSIEKITRCDLTSTFPESSKNHNHENEAKLPSILPSGKVYNNIKEQ